MTFPAAGLSIETYCANGCVSLPSFCYFYPREKPEETKDSSSFQLLFSQQSIGVGGPGTSKMLPWRNFLSFCVFLLVSFQSYLSAMLLFVVAFLHLYNQRTHNLLSLSILRIFFPLSDSLRGRPFWFLSFV